MQDNSGELWKRLGECESAASGLQDLWAALSGILDEQEGKLQAAASGAHALAEGLEEERAARRKAEVRAEECREAAAREDAASGEAGAEVERLEQRVAELESERDDLAGRLSRAVTALRRLSEDHQRRASEMDRVRDRLSELSGTSGYADEEAAGDSDEAEPAAGGAKQPRPPAAYAEDLDATKALLSRLTEALDDDAGSPGAEPGGTDEETDGTGWGAP